MFKIGDFSKLSRVPVSALRYYADIGLLEPLHIDEATNYRYYSLDQLPRLNRILALKDLGLSLEQIKQVLHETLEASEIRGMLRLKEAELQAELADREARLARVQARLKSIEMEDTMPDQEVILKSIDSQWGLSLREIVPLPQSVEHLFMEIYPGLMENQIEVTSPPFTIFYDNEFKDQNLDIEVVFPIANKVDTVLTLDGERNVTVRQLASIPKVASIIHTGDFDTLMETYTVIGKWIEANKYQIVGPIREIYLRPPGMNEDEAGITEIQFPVEQS